MNSEHAELCSSQEWATYLQTELLAPLLAASGVSLGPRMLELGPGPGAATDWLRHHVDDLTAVEIDPAAAAKLSDRFAGTNVTVAVGDSSRLGLPAEAFDSVGSFTMLHHVATRDEQHRLFAEAYRVLKPGGVLIGSDSLPSNDLHCFHSGDTYNPVEPSYLFVLLQALGFRRITVTADEVMTFVAQKSPETIPNEGCQS